MKITTKITIIFFILLGIFTFLCIYPNNNVKALTQSQAAQAIADFALNVANNHAAETHYVSPDSFHRVNAYKGTKTYSVDGKVVFGFDCNGFVSFVVHNALGIGKDTFTKFAYPSGSKWVPNGGYFKEVASGLTLNSALSIAQVGDLICSNGDGNTHIQIYVGNREIVDCAGEYPNAVQIRGENRTRNIRHSNGSFTVLRINEGVAEGITTVNNWLNQIGVIKPDMASYYDQKGQIIYKNADGSYVYENGTLITYENGQYVDQNGNVVEINYGNFVIDERTGQVIGTVADVMQQEEFQGILRLQRVVLEQVGTDEFGEPIHEEQIRDLKYISREELEQKVNNNDITALDYYSLSGEALLVAKSIETMVMENGVQTSYQAEIDLLSIEYRTIVAKYSMPFEFQLGLQAISQNPEFIIELGNFQREGEIVLILQDYTVIDTIIYETETYIDTTEYEKDIPTQQLVEVSSSSDTEYFKRETIIKTLTPVLNIQSADTWIYKVENTYTSTYGKVEGEPQTTTEGPNTETIRHQNGDETKVTYTIKATTTNNIEKVTWNQGPSSKESKEDLILPLFDEKYDIPSSNTDNNAGGLLTSGAEMLFSLLESSEKTQEHSKIMRYLLYKYNNEEKYYGVKDLGLDSVEEKFYTIDDNTTYDTIYSTAAYTSFVDDNGSNEGRAVAKVAEYFIRAGNAKNLLIYSQDGNRTRGFNLWLSSGTTKERVQKVTYSNKLVYDCSSFVSAMYNLVLGIPEAAWTTDMFDAYKNEPIDGSKKFFYYVGPFTQVKDSLQPGDILIADKNMGNKYDHAMIYLGNGRIAHASSSNDLEVSNLWSTTNYVLRLKPNVANSINTKVTWPDDGQTETVSL